MRAEQPAGTSDQPLLESLEQRMLFSVEPFGLSADLFGTSDDPLSNDLRDLSQPKHGYELVLINDNLHGIDTLVADLQQQIEAGRRLVVEVLDSRHSGMEQVEGILSTHDSLKAVHILSHGVAGGLQLGSSWIDSATINSHSNSFSTWNNHLTSESQVLFYGCDLAANNNGTDLLNQIATMTGAVVAASSDSTGHALLQGDWDLEYRTDTIDIKPLLSDDTEDAWLSELAAYSYRNGDTNSYSQTIDTYLSQTSTTQSNNDSGDLVLSGTPSASQQALLRFDDIIGDIGNRVAPGITIASATLTLEISNPSDPGSQASVYRMLQDWDEYTSWSHMTHGVQTDDSEAATALLAQFNADAAGTVSIDVTSSVQDWLNGEPNYGWLITSDANGSELHIQSSDSSQTAQRPQLTIVTNSGLIVSTTNDDVDGDTSSISALEASPGGDGEISLREAVIATNNTAGADTIFLPAGRYEFAISGGDELAASGDLDILDELTITGAGRDATIIDANDIHRHFDVRDDNGFASLTLEDLTLTDGSFDWGGAVSVHSGMNLSLGRVNVTDNTTDSADNGGAIHNLGSLSVTDSVFERNYAANKEGGAIYTEGTATITGSTFTDNSSKHGGALQFGGTTLTISDSDFHTNLSTDRGGALDLNAGTTTILRSSLHNNTAEDGGAINMDGSAQLTIEQSTISGNQANVEGGGIRARGGSNMLDIVSSTIAWNDATNVGGGIDNHNGDVTTTVTNSIFQGNTNNNGTNPEAFRDNSNLLSGGYNTISDGSGGLTSTGDQNNQNANLNQTLTYPTGSNVAVHTLYADSPARDSGQPSVTTTDNNGHPRVGAPDRGAAESYSSPVAHTASAPAIDGEVDALWSNAQAEPLLDYSGDVTTPPTNPGATWRATWSDEALYLLVEVSDNTPHEDSADIWHDDAIAVYLDPDVSRSSSYDGVDDTNFYVGRSHDTVTLVNDPLLLTNVSVATVDTLDGYTKEIAIPWSELGITPVAGTQMGIELHLNDDADGGNNNTELLWADSQDRAWTDPSSFGAIVLDAANDSAGPDGLNHGIAINKDGGNNTWFQAPTSVTQGLESYTVQTRFTTSTVQGLSIIPWVTAGVSYFLTADMANNTPRTHTEVWDAATGTKTGYLDGVQIRQDTYAHLTGRTVTTSHPLVIGQNNTGGQTSLNTAAFDPARFFSGTIHDVRVYDYALAPDEIDQNLHRQFSAENPPTGLIANWRFDRLTGDNNDRVVDLINPGINDMIVHQIAADGSTWIDSTPSDQLTIADDAQTNDVVGYVHPTDAGVIDESYSYDLVDDAGGRFSVNRATGQLLIADGSSIEAGTDPTQYALTIRVTDESGNAFDRRLTILANPVNEAPTLTGFPTTNTAYLDGGGAVALGADLLPDDPELTQLDSYDGFEITLSRDGGADAEDVFTLGSYDSGGSIIWADGAGVTIGTILQNSAGTLQLQFNASATSDAVRDTVRAIRYSNTGDTSTYRTVALSWTLDDNNTAGAQGSGGAQTAAYSSQVEIIPSSPDVPTGLGHGISINTDGGNDTYLLADDVSAILGGLSTVTMEAHYSIDTMNTRNALLSYSAVAGTDALKLLVRSNGVVDVGVLGIDVLSNPVPQLLDGERHSVAATWDANGGHLRMYVDGELIHATTGVAPGQTLHTGGTLILGMEQDSPGGGFEVSEVLSGTLYDVRLWNTVRAEHEIAASHNQRFDTAILPDDLVANWQMNGLNTDGKVVDVVSGNQLSIQHTTDAGFSASTPVTGLTVTEGAANGTEIGSLMVSTAAPVKNLVRDPHFAYTGPAGNAVYNTGEGIGDAGIWLVDSGNVEVVGNFQTTPIGGYGIDLDGLTPGSISQTLSTEVGRTYQINFAFAGNFDANADKTVRVSAGANSSDFSLAMPSGWTKDNLLWQQRSMRFVATASDTVLSFSSLSASGSHGPIIGDVSVVELSDPVAILLSAKPELSYDPNTGKFYQLNSTPVTWATAHANALATQLNGVAGQLVTISSEYENTLTRTLAGTDVHLGLSDQTTEGQWYWLSGSSDAELMWTGGNSGSAQNGFYNNWNGSEPNNHNGNEDHAVMFYVSGLWNDAKPFENYVTLIEWDAADVLQLSEFTYNIETDSTNAYAIDTNTGALSVVNGNAIDYESATANDITVRITNAHGDFHDEVITIDITDVPAPVIANIEPGTLTYTENDGAVPITDTLTISDADDTVLNSATVAIRNAFYNSIQDSLQFTDYGPFSSIWDAATGVLTIDGPATIAEWQSALRTVTYTNNSDNPDAGIRYFDFSVYDGFEHSSIAHRQGNVIAVNDAPTLGDANYPNIPEDSTAPESNTVENIFAGQFSDPDGTFTGIGITGNATTTEGTWEYSTDSGATWPPVGSVTPSTALMLDVDTELRFLPAAHYYGPAPALTAVGVDSSYTGSWTDLAAVQANLTTRGGSTAFATDDSTIQLSVTPIGPTGLATGVALNTNDGNDAYLLADDGGALLGGLSEFTIETRFSIDESMTFTPLFSYATATRANDLLLAIENDGTIFFHLDNERIDVPLDYPNLLDGNQHSLSVSWASLHGDIAFYVDGNLVHTATGLKAGYVLNTAGALVFGQDQDSVNGGYNPDELLKGTLYDVRIWSEARTATEIAGTHQHRLYVDSLPTTLIANWQMDGFDGSGQVVDVVGTNNLSVVHVPGAGFTPGTATTTLTVSEGASNGTVIGYLAPQSSTQTDDLVQDGRFTYSGDTAVTHYSAGSKIGGAGGFWEVDSGNVGVEADWSTTPLGGKPIDLDGTTPGSISQTLNTVAGNTYQLRFAYSGNFTDGIAKSMTVSVGDASETFTVDPPDGWAFDNALWNQRSLTFNATGPATTLSFASDSISGNFGPVIADVQVVELPGAVSSILAADTTLTYDAGTGKFYRAVSTPASWLDARDQAIAAKLNGVNGQLVTIASAYENSLIQSFAVGLNRSLLIGASDTTTEGEWRWQQGYDDDQQFWSGRWAATGGLAITGMYSNWNNLEPNDSSDEDAVLLRPSDGAWNDVSTDRASLYVIEWDANAVISSFQYSLQSNPSGAFSIDSTTGALVLSDASLIDYESVTSHDIVVRVTDAGGEFHDETVTIQIADLAGPALADIETAALAYVENSGAAAISTNMTVGGTVNDATITISGGYVAGEDTLTFVDTASIFHNWDDGTGTLTLSGTDTTAAWQLALRSVSYVNSSDDPTGGSRTVQFTVSNSEDNSNSVSRTITVSPVNDAPFIATASPQTVTEDDTNPAGQSVTDIFGGALSDIDGNVLGIAISNDTTTTEGQWQYSTDTGANWYPFQISVSDVNALVLGLDTLLRFVPATDYHGAIPALTAVAVDNSQGGTTTAGNLSSVADVSSRGGSTAYSSASAQIEGTVTPVFDVPTNVGSVPVSFTVSEDVSTDLDLSSVEIDSRDHIGDLTLRLSTQTGGLLTARSDPSVSITSGSGTVQLTASATALNTYLNDISSIAYLHGTSHTQGTAADMLVIELEYGSTSGIMANPAIHITSINDAPLTADSTLNMVEDTPYTLSLSDFEFSDPHDGNGPLAIQIVGTPLNVNLQLNGTAVGDGDTISATDISAGNLVLHPQLNTNGNSYDSLSYRVQDDGGVANGGDDTSTNIATLTLDITAVNDTPDLTVSPLALLRSESITLTGHIAAIDPDVEPDQRIITLSAVPAYGSLQLNGVTLVANNTFTQANVDDGSLRYLHDGTEAADDTLALLFTDQGSDATSVGIAKILNISVTETHPQPEPDSAVVDEAGLIDIQVLDNDQPADEPLNASSTTVVQAPLYGNASFDDSGVARYEHNGSETTSDSFSYTVADSGGQVSDPVSVSISITPVNDQPELQVDPNGPAATEQSTPVIVSPALRVVDAELSLIDNFNGSTLQLQRNTGADANDQFSAATPALSALTDGTALGLNGQTVGSILHNAGGSLLLQFNAAATGAIVNEVANSIGYTYTGDTPPATITMQWLFSDANSGLQGTGGAQFVSASVELDITAINDTPLLSVGSDGPVHTEGENAVPVAPLLNITDAELDLLDSDALPTITLQRTTGANSLDEFVASGQLGTLTTGTAFTDNSVRLGTIIDNSEGLLRIAFDAGINTSQISSALQQIAYRYLGEAPPPQISLQWSFYDGNSGAQGEGGAAVGAVESVVTIHAVDDAPVIGALVSTTLPYSHRSPALPVVSGIEFTDPDSTALRHASIWVEGYQPGIDVLALTPTGGLTLNWDADIGVLTLEGPADLATYQSALRTLTYQSVDLPAATETLRQLKLNITDDSGTRSDTELVELLLTIPENPLTLTVNQGLQIFTGDRTAIELSDLAAVDIYSPDRPDTSIEFHLSELPQAGLLWLNDQPVSIDDVFTQHDLQQGKLVYQHTAATTGWDLFSFELRDGNEDGAIPINGNFEIEIRAPLEFAVNNNWSMLEGETVTLTTDQIAHSGGYIPAADLLITADSSVGAVEFLHNTSTQVINQFTPHDIESGAVALRHDGSEQLGTTLQLALHQRVDGDLALLDTRTVDLTIIDVADSPMGADSTMATDHIKAVAITEQQIEFNDTDDGDVLKALQITDVPQHGTLQLSNVPLEAGAIVPAQQLRAGQLIYVPDPLTSGTVTDNIHFTLTDSGDPATGGSIQSTDANTIEIVVTSDHQPKANPDTLRVEEGGVATQLETGATRVTDNDTDWDTPNADLLVQLLQEPTVGVLTLNQDGTFSYQHDGSETQSDSFSYRVVDDVAALSGTDGSVTTVQVAIEPRNDAPEAGVAASQWLQTNEILQLELPDDLFTDRDPADTLTLSATLADGSPLPPWLSFNSATASFSGTPDTAVLGTLEILVIATDVAGATAESRFEITVGPLIAEATEAPLPYNGEFDHFSAPAPVTPTDNNQQRSNATVMSNQSLTLASEASAKDEEKTDDAPLERDASALPEIPADSATREPANHSEDRVVRHRQEPSVEKAIIEDTDTILHKKVVELQQLLSVAKGQTPAINDVAIQELNRIREEMQASSNTAHAVVVSSAMISTGLSVGYILWLIRGGVLLSSVMTSMPAWRFIDPLPVLHDLDSGDEDDDHESLESLVDGENSDETSERSLSTDSEARNPEGGVQKP